jgi:hypothetical protein
MGVWFRNMGIVALSMAEVLSASEDWQADKTPTANSSNFLALCNILARSSTK